MTIRVEEKSLELALVKASGKLGVTQENVDYRIEKESQGFLGMFGKKIAIEAWVKGEKGRSAAHSSPKKQKDLSGSEVEELQIELKNFCADICEKMFGEEVEVETSENNGRFILNIQNEYFAGQLTKSTRLAESFEHLLRKKPKHIRQELPFRIFVDAKNVRVGRENELATMAKDLSNKVHENRRPIVLNYRSSYDRKIIHMALDKDDRVYTKSIGSGPNRKLMILPSKDNLEVENAPQEMS